MSSSFACFLPQSFAKAFLFHNFFRLHILLCPETGFLAPLDATWSQPTIQQSMGNALRLGADLAGHTHERDVMRFVVAVLSVATETLLRPVDSMVPRSMAQWLQPPERSLLRPGLTPL